ncbi:unnamed protein product [Thelazia callipaeda]|uniref:Zinc/iron permease n=1 Tax=Thelazia callipaeda TaxID=103827 RepID=A0A0N5CQY9_THECL|nr:unnamed protein product [Thelazia callipaeda]
MIVFEAEPLFYGFLSITVVSLLSLSGLIFLPFLKGKWRNRWMQIFIALAVIGVHNHVHQHHEHQIRNDHNDFVIPTNHSSHDKHHDNHEKHLHSHDYDYHDRDHIHHDHDHHDCDHSQHKHDHDHDHHHHHEMPEKANEHNDDHTVLLKMSIVLGAAYVLYLLEFISSLPIWKVKNKVVHPEHTATSITVYPDKWTGSEKLRKNIKKKSFDSLSSDNDDPVIVCGLKSTAFVIIFGDAIHNFIDGIAVGASFIISNQVGFATSLAIAFHELPHELGDFAVLLESGLSVPRAIVLNFVSALTAYLGLIAGLAAISVHNAVEILLAITAGMFLYVAWLDMLIHLKREATCKHDKWYITLTLQNIGFLLGFAVMFAIGWYEEFLISL